ncbi:hypothetical protein V1460_03895 [Streptomyces sp. SCSIO 30461]|uniref:hypothetical protein n=1 Tax=Streptomyces sp. SCSIO 30461 TaxID=3118085 RepID=UPI0030CCFC54
MAGGIGVPAQSATSGAQVPTETRSPKGGKGANEWGQAVAALVVAGSLAVGLVLFQKGSSTEGDFGDTVPAGRWSFDTGGLVRYR